MSNQNLKHLLGKISRSTGIDKVAVNIGLEGLLWKIICRQEEQEIHAYFDGMQDRIDAIVDKLSNEESKEIYKNAIRYRWTRQVKDRPAFNLKNQYFVEGVALPKANDVFVDCGAYTGDTYKQLMQFQAPNLTYVGFEPNSKTFEQLKETTRGNDSVCLINKGTGDANTRLYITINGGSSTVSEEKPAGEAEVIDVTRIDDVKECENATWIKMDIEGSELASLKGAIDTITKNRPVLTICIYHSNEEMITIPEYIMSLGMDYNYYVYHHDYRKEETVFYAVPKERC